MNEICQMRVTFAEGSSRVIASAETWKYALEPITFTCIYGGEDYDARREQPGWDRPGFDDRLWSAAEVHVPTTDADKVSESGRPAKQVRGIAFLRAEPAPGAREDVGRAIFKVGPGRYEFRSPL